MYDLIIIGGGPAGLTAGLYARRGGLKTLIIESMVAGGQTNLTGEIENYPSIQSISGFELSNNMLEQVTSLGVEFEYSEVTEINVVGDIKKVVTSDKAFEAKALILAMGAHPRQMGIEAEESFVGRGVSYCAHCDGNFFKNKDVAVVGGGNTALQDALYLSNICKTVYLIHRRDEFRGNKILSDKLAEKSNIVLKLNCIPQDILGEIQVKQLKIQQSDQ
ncbi:MAG: FAD-dependent oxidoreductase, partial [Clostridia bacterium]